MFVAVALLIGAAPTIAASVPAKIGPYRIQISTDPGVIPVGKARLRIDVTDAAGKPVEGVQIRSLVKMPAMSMGEKETVAQPVPGKPGSYTTEASFAMAGGYEASIAISGPLGDASGTVAMETGQNTESAGDASGFSVRSLLPWLLVAAGALLAAFVLLRMRQTGQRLAWKSFVTRGTVTGILLLLITFAASRYAINHWRRPGAMTPIDAQGMEMKMPPPPGTAAVTLAEVTLGPIERTVSYSGQAVAFNEQDVIARTEGWLNWMPFYTGQKVKADEVVARLDIGLLHAHLNERQAAVNMATQGVSVSERERFQAVAEVDRIRAELRGKNEALAAAQAEVSAAQEERNGAEAELASKQSMIADAEAMVAAMEADRQFWQQQNARNKILLDKNALSMEEYQRETASAANANAKLQQAQARLSQAQADARAAQAMTRRADALITAAEKRRQQVAADIQAAEAAVKSAEATTEVAAAKIEEARAGANQARENLAITTVTHSYAEIRAQIDGVVTQRLISVGQLVQPGQAVLKIAQTDPIRLQANVAEVDLSRVKVGSRVAVRGQNSSDAPMVATVTAISPTVDPTARTGIVEAILPNRDGKFVPGQFIGVNISTGKSENALRVPQAAIRTRTQASSGILANRVTNYVWVAEESGGGQLVAKPVDVETGIDDGVSVQILSGLHAGQKVIVSGGDYLKSGATVTAVNSEVAQ
jgi:RND family efflux transporter MFP subunit